MLAMRGMKSRAACAPRPSAHRRAAGSGRALRSPPGSAERRMPGRRRSGRATPGRAGRTGTAEGTCSSVAPRSASSTSRLWRRRRHVAGPLPNRTTPPIGSRSPASSACAIVSLIDHRHLAACNVALVDAASLHERNPHRLEIVGTHTVVDHADLLAVSRLIAVDARRPCRCRVPMSSGMAVASDAVSTPRQCAEPLQQLLVEHDPARLVVAVGQHIDRGEKTRSQRESGIDELRARRSCARTARRTRAGAPTARPGRRPAPAAAIRAAWPLTTVADRSFNDSTRSGSRRAQRRQQPEHQRRRKGRGHRKRQHRRAQLRGRSSRETASAARKT